jgi:hypothetical protein
MKLSIDEILKERSRIEMEELQKEKLRHEIKNIKRPFYKHYTFWLGFISLLFAGVTLMNAKDLPLRHANNNRHDNSKVQMPINNESFSVALYTYNTDKSIFNLAKNLLLDNGFSLSQAKELSCRPFWLSWQPAILYYDDALVEAAKNLAIKLELLTGKHFIYAKGAGYGVPSKIRSQSLRIHIV